MALYPRCGKTLFMVPQQEAGRAMVPRREDMFALILIAAEPFSMAMKRGRDRPSTELLAANP